MQVRIQVQTSKGTRSFPVVRFPCTLGSDPGDGVRLNHASIRPGHAVMMRNREGVPMLAPLAGEVLTVEGPIGAPVVLTDRSRFRIGSVGIEIRIEGAASAASVLPRSSGTAAPRQPTNARAPIATATSASSSTASGASAAPGPAQRGTSRLMLAVSVGFILLLLSGAAVPVLLLYGRITEERAKVADSAVPGAGGGPRPEGRGAPPASSPAVHADVAPSGAADQPVVDLPSLLRMSELLAAVPRGTREVDGVSLIRELERFVATYGEFNQAYQSLRYGEGTNDCESSRRFSAMVELILARFDRRSRGEPAEAQMDALEKVAESLSVSSTRVFADLVGVKAEEMMDDIYNGAHDPNWKGWVSKGYPEDDWAIGRFGEEGTRTRLSEGVAKARAAAETACGEADRREAGLVDAARAVAVLETQDGLGPRVEAVGLESLSYVQREQFAAQAKRFESASGRARETARDIERDLELGWLKTERSSELRAYVTRIRQWHTFAWWFGIPALRAALDAQVCYIGGEPREWANAFLRSMQEIPRSDIERVARLRWERDGMEVHRQMYAGTKYEGPDLGDVERETPAWLEQTILGEVLLRSRRDPAWRARVQAEAPQQLKSLEPWLGPVSDGSDLDNPVSSLDPSAPPPPPPPPPAP